MGDIEEFAYRQVSAKIIGEAVLSCIKSAGGDVDRLTDLAIIINDNAAAVIVKAQSVNASPERNDHD